MSDIFINSTVYESIGTVHVIWLGFFLVEFSLSVQPIPGDLQYVWNRCFEFLGKVEKFGVFSRGGRTIFLLVSKFSSSLENKL